MRRREFMSLLSGAVAAWPLAARAQQPDRTRRIGALLVNSESDQLSRRNVTAFQQGLNKLGWTAGRNIQIDYRWGISDLERARAAISEILGLSPDVILVEAISAVRAAQQATRTVPIVFTAVSEPVKLGFVASLAHPGGNITGFSNLEPTLGAKLLELMKEIAPGTKRVAFIFNPTSNPVAPLFFRSVEAAGPKLAVETIEAPIHEQADIEAVIGKLGREPASSLIVAPDTFLSFHHKLIVESAARHRVPAIYAFRYYVAAGGLVSYGPDRPDQFLRAAAYVDRILRGEKPADLPVQQPTKFELVINLKAAKALGLTVPPTLLTRADEVIE